MTSAAAIPMPCSGTKIRKILGDMMSSGIFLCFEMLWINCVENANFLSKSFVVSRILFIFALVMTNKAFEV